LNVHAVIALFSALTLHLTDTETVTTPETDTALPASVTQDLQASPSSRVGFSILVDELESDLSILSASVMPNETVEIVADADLHAADGAIGGDGETWTWTAPDTPGHYELFFQRNGETMLVNMFVLTPFKNGTDDILNGYRVGKYNPEPLRGLDNYIPPQGFIDMQPGMEDIQITPHFKLGQFICKQQPGHDPTYLLVESGMLVKLELLLEKANEKGWTADTFIVMSGFRTPFYNAAIGNTTTSSRHLFGDASDIYIDHDGDGVMDDLDGDGKITKADAVALAELAKDVAKADEKNWPRGGIGIYGANAVHGPFVHIDARGYAARW
tara:strand:+ start:17309 stop:18286 length:978 start_codon:yes stop_codon:yes gene_type:complete